MSSTPGTVLLTEERRSDSLPALETGPQAPADRRGAIRHLPWLGVLLVIHLAVFARVIFLTPQGIPYAIVPWDFILAYYPWLIYVGDCLHSHIFPFWCPYAAAGTPFFLNPQNQVFSPPTFLIGWLFGYSERIAQLQDVFMIYFGGVGAYLLSHSLWRSRWAALITAVCFSFSSAMFSHLEHMNWINSYALIPWLFWITTLTARRVAWSFPALAFLIYFIITAGYPAIYGMLFLWLGAYVVYLAWFDDTQRGALTAPMDRRRYLLSCALAGGLGLLLSSVHWLPIVARL